MQVLAVVLLLVVPAVSFNPLRSGLPARLAKPPCTSWRQGVAQHRMSAATTSLSSGSSKSTGTSPASSQSSQGSALPIRAADVQERTIWGYWAQGFDDMPDFFKLCVETWKTTNPNWDIRILDLDTVYDYLNHDELPNLFLNLTSHQTASDAVRLGLLARYGGIWFDVNVLVRCDLDSLWWSEIESGEKTGGIFYHPHFGTDRFNNKDFVESWGLATKARNPFFVRWREFFVELLHDKLDIYGISKHPLYDGLDLSGINKMNQRFGVANFDFREYLAIHSMCHRVIETDPELSSQFTNTFIKIDAAATAFKTQMWMESQEQTVQFALLSPSEPEQPDFFDAIAVMKLTSAHYGIVTSVPRNQLVDDIDSDKSPFRISTLLGRLVCESLDAAKWRASAEDDPRLGGLVERAMKARTAIVQDDGGRDPKQDQFQKSLAERRAKAGTVRAAGDEALFTSDEAMSLLDEITPQKATTWLRICSDIEVSQEAGQWERTLELLEELRTKDGTPDSRTFSLAIAACGQGGQWQRALSLVEEMRATEAELSVNDYEAAISACEQGGQWQRALSLLEEMRYEGLTPTLASFNMVISVCEQAKQWQSVMSVLKLMRRTGDGIAPSQTM